MENDMNYDKDPDATLAIGQLKKFAGLYLARKKLREKDVELTKKITEMQTALIDHMIDHEIANLPLKGGRTIYIDAKIWPKKKNENITTRDIVEALAADGLSDMTAEGYSTMRLASYLRELEKNNEKIPKHLAEVIEASEVTNLIVKGHK